MAWYLLGDREEQLRYETGDAPAELGVLVYPMDPPLQALRRVLAANK